MSLYGQYVRLLGLRNRIQDKLVSLGLIANQNRAAGDLEDCTETIEDIDEVTPYLISTTGIKNVANYKYAQIDQSAWVPAGTIPSGLESHLTGLGSTGIMTSRPRNPISIGTVYPNTGSQGMYANQLEIDGDVIKAENIKSGVQILGVTGSYDIAYDYVEGDAYQSGLSVQFEIPFSTVDRIKTIYLTLGYAGSLSANRIAKLYVLDPSYLSGDSGSLLCEVAMSEGSSLSGSLLFAYSVRQSSGVYILTLSVPTGLSPQIYFQGTYTMYYSYL